MILALFQHHCQLLTFNLDNTQTTNVEMKEKDEKLERLSESHSEDNFDDSRDSRHSSQLGTRGIKNSRSHTDGDLKLLSNTTTNDTYQYQKTTEKEAEENRSKKVSVSSFHFKNNVFVGNVFQDQLIASSTFLY